MAIYLIDRLAQFLRGALGLDKFHAGSLVAGWMAGSLLTNASRSLRETR
jgi:hypothetical protein